MNLPSVKTSFVEATNQLNNPPCRIFFKNELEQPSGSFKLRGIGNLVATRIQEAEELGKNKIIVFSSSGGNAGLAAAYAAKYYKVECTVVLPEVTKPEVVDKLRGLGLMLFFTVLIGEKPTRTCEKLSLKESKTMNMRYIVILSMIQWFGRATRKL